MKSSFTAIFRANSAAFQSVLLSVLFVFSFAAAQTIAAQSALEGFNPNANSTIRAIAVQPDGKILIGGEFTSVGGVDRSKIARLNADGTVDTIFNPNADALVLAIAVQPDGKILAGGFFTNIGSQSRSGIARLDAVSGLADSWNSNANGAGVLTIAVQPDGKIVVGGGFFNIGGQSRNNLARLETNGTADASFNPNANNTVFSIAVQPDGKILAGGNFTSIGGQTRNYFARLSNNTAALSTLAVTQTTLTLTRDGSAPQFARVIFERSTDNGATWTLLGTATNSRAECGIRKAECGMQNKEQLAPNAAGYTLSGQNIPTGQNVLIRARGFYNAGYQNGSVTTEDKVQNAFLIAPTAASVSVSGRVIVGKRGLLNATVTLTDQSGNTRTARTSAFGYYRFDEVEAGLTYIVSVQSKRFQFPTQVVNIVEDLSEFNFYSNGEGLQ